MSAQLDTDAFGFVIGDLSRLIRAEMERRIAAAGLSVTPGEGRTLAHIARAGAVRQNALAESMGVEAMTLSGYLDRLESRHLVVRRTDPSDRRAKLVALTPNAEEVLQEIRAIGASMRADLSRGMTQAEWTRLTSALKHIRDGLTGMKGQTATAKEADG